MEKEKIENIPLEIIRNREYSPLQAMVKYLRENDLNSKEIAKLLNRHISTINTTLMRVKLDSGLIKVNK